MTLGFVIVGAMSWAATPIDAADLPGARKRLLEGKYAECIELTSAAIGEKVFGEDAYLLQAEAQETLGRHAEARDTLDDGLKRYPWSIRLRWSLQQTTPLAGQPERADVLRAEIQDMAGRAPWRYSDAENLIAIGRSVLRSGADPRLVLENFFDRAEALRPDLPDAWIARGELALSKRDFALTAEMARAGLKKHGDDPRLTWLLARALASSDHEAAEAALRTTLERNPRFVPALLWTAEMAIDSERFNDADLRLDEVDAIHPKHPISHALRAVLAWLQRDDAGYQKEAALAQEPWAENPEPVHLIGRKLSEKYFFEQGADLQRAVLRFDPNHLQAKAQLASDLMRLGREDEAWKLVDDVHETDGYDVPMYNLVKLKESLAKFRTLETEGFTVRMDDREARVYGDDVLDLLKQARRTLGEKYGYTNDDTVLVEIFPNQNDFAVRTFGVPGAAGYLGVCFGKVITANSPASQGQAPSNWQSVLWHEYCHVVTLELTRHNIPRWLSEGISVYEERQAHATWGQRMNPVHRDWILSGKLKPIQELSGAFLRPDSPQHLNFAYFESSMVVEFLIERYGLPALKEVLNDLGNRIPIDQALDRRTSGLDQLEEEFREHALEKARQYAADVDWERYDLSAVLDEDDPERLHGWLAEHRNSYQGLTVAIRQLIQRRELERAEELLKRFIQLFPGHTGAENPYETLAELHRRRENTEAERAVLSDLADRSDDNVKVFLRLLELNRQLNDHEGVMGAAKKLLAANPLLPQLYRAWAPAAEALDDRETAIRCWRALLELNPLQQAESHYRLAKLLHAEGDAAAKTHVLAALEIAPRHRGALKLLLQMREPGAKSSEGF